MNARLLGAAHVAAALLVMGCTITQSVTPLAGSRPQAVCLQRNPEVLMDGFHAELARQIEARGISVQSFDGAPPADCDYRVAYTASWRWDMAMYLAYAQINVIEGDRPVGSAVYDATQGGGNMRKFGPTAEKLAPLVARLFG